MKTLIKGLLDGFTVLFTVVSAMIFILMVSESSEFYVTVIWVFFASIFLTNIIFRMFPRRVLPTVDNTPEV